MDMPAVLADSQTRDAMTFTTFILDPENAAMISNFAR